MASTEGLSGGGQGIPMTTTPAQYVPGPVHGAGQPSTTTTGMTTTTTTQAGYSGQGQGQGQGGYGQQQQGYHQPQQHQQGGIFNAPGQALGQMFKPQQPGPDAPHVAYMVQQPIGEESTPTEACNIFLAIFIPLCAIASTILTGLAGATTISIATAWVLDISATVITAVGVVGADILKRMWANQSQAEAENTMGIAVLAHANIRAVAVKALAMMHYEVKKLEMRLRDAEVILVIIVGLAAAILSGIGGNFFGDARVLSIISAYFNAVAGALVVLFEILANGRKLEAKRLEDQLKRNSLVADYLRADYNKKQTILQDRVEALTTV